MLLLDARDIELVIVLGPPDVNRCLTIFNYQKVASCLPRVFGIIVIALGLSDRADP